MMVKDYKAGSLTGGLKDSKCQPVTPDFLLYAVVAVLWPPFTALGRKRETPDKLSSENPNPAVCRLLQS